MRFPLSETSMKWAPIYIPLVFGLVWIYNSYKLGRLNQIHMKKKILLTVAFVISLLPMLLNQYGGRKGVQEITGLINLLNPIGLAAAASFLVGVWAPFRKKIVNTVLGAVGCIGMVISEVYKFFTWHALTITGEISLQHSIRFAFPEFYVGLCVSLAMVVVYFVITLKVKE